MTFQKRSFTITNYIPRIISVEAVKFRRYSLPPIITERRFKSLFKSSWHSIRQYRRFISIIRHEHPRVRVIKGRIRVKIFVRIFIESAYSVFPSLILNYTEIARVRNFEVQRINGFYTIRTESIKNSYYSAYAEFLIDTFGFIHMYINFRTRYINLRYIRFRTVKQFIRSTPTWI